MSRDPHAWPLMRTARELYARAIDIDFDNSTPALRPPASSYPGRTRAMRDRIGAGVLRSGRTWNVLEAQQARDVSVATLDDLLGVEAVPT